MKATITTTVLSTTLLLSATLSSAPGVAAQADDIRQLSPQAGLEFKPEIDDLVANPPAEEPDVIRFTALGHYYKQALTSTKPRVTSSEKFETLPGTRTKVFIPAGKDALVNLAFTAESSCTEADSMTHNWCEVRILVDGVEASPQASAFPSDTFAFDSTDEGTETFNSWEAHAMDRHYCIENRHSNSNKTVPIEVQWKVTNFDAGNPPSFWLDDWSFTIQLAEACRQEKLKFEDVD